MLRMRLWRPGPVVLMGTYVIPVRSMQSAEKEVSPSAVTDGTRSKQDVFVSDLRSCVVLCQPCVGTPR